MTIYSKSLRILVTYISKQQKCCLPISFLLVCLSEWLRRWTANPLCSARVGSNPAADVNFFVWMMSYDFFFSILLFFFFLLPACCTQREQRRREMETTEKQRSRTVTECEILSFQSMILCIFLKDLPHLSICSFKSFQNTFICVCALYLHNEQLQRHELLYTSLFLYICTLFLHIYLFQASKAIQYYQKRILYNIEDRYAID